MIDTAVKIASMHSLLWMVTLAVVGVWALYRVAKALIDMEERRA